MSDPQRGYGMHGAQERLAQLRNPSMSAEKSRVERRNVRLEVLVGASVVLMGVSLALGLVLFRREPSVLSSTESTTLVVQPERQSNGLLDGEALIPIALEPGNFPPDLKVGDSVRVVLSPTSDGQGNFRQSPRPYTVTSVSDGNDTTGQTVVTVRAPIETAIDLASSGPVLLSIVARRESE